MSEKIPNYYYDCFKAYLAFKGKKRKKTFEKFYKENKELIHNDGMLNSEICKVFNITRYELKKTIDGAYEKIRKYERKLGFEISDKDFYKG